MKSAFRGYIAHEALTRGAAIAFYAVTSLAPVLFVVVGIAGLVFGQDLVRSNLVDQVSGLVGKEGGELIKTMLSRAADKESSTWASILGVLTVIVTASGVFGELQTALNRTWEVENTSDQPWFSIIRARAVSLGLVAVLGFLLMISLAASAAVSALGNYLGGQSGFHSPAFGSKHGTVASTVHGSVRCDLQGIARHPIKLARGRGGCVSHCNTFYRRQVPDWLVSRDDGRWLWLRCCGGIDPDPSLGVLLVPDPLARCGNHASNCS